MKFVRYSIIAILITSSTYATNNDQELIKIAKTDNLTSDDLNRAKVLLDQGANPNALNQNQAAPLFLIFARPFNDQKIAADFANLLIQKGAKIDRKYTDGSTPLLWAAGSYFDAAKLLLEKGADPNVVNQNKSTPLHWVFGGIASNDNKEKLAARVDLARMLIEKGAKINVENTVGSTPLINAASGGYVDGVKLLLDKGAQVNAQANDGATALALAIYHNSNRPEVNELVELLVNKGADKDLAKQYIERIKNNQLKARENPKQRLEIEDRYNKMLDLLK